MAATATTARRANSDQLNWLGVVALVLSGIGILSPIGIWLGYLARRQISRNGGLGREFATAAIIVGWLWIVFIILGAIAFLWILT